MAALDSRKCTLCKKAGYDHRSRDLACPTGTKTAIGWIHYHLTNRFTPKPEKQST